MKPVQDKDRWQVGAAPLVQDEAASGHCASAINRRLVTRFGDMVDVRNRGAVRINRFAGSIAAQESAPAVVRIWHAEQCREMTAHQARAFAAQLMEAAALAESQNGH